MAIVGCHNGIGIALAQQLTNRGINAGTFDQIPADADGAVILDFEDDGRDVKASASRLFAVARRFASNQGGRGGALFVVQSGDVAWRSGLIGLTKTLALEHPNCQVRAIEVDRGTRLPAQVAQIVADELVHGGNATEVIVKSGGLRLIFEEMELPIPDVPTSQTRHADWSSPVIVASGGARGVTAACLIALAGKTPARFALLGRTALSPEPAGLDDARDSSQIQAALLTAVREAGAMPSPKELAARAREIMACRDIRKTLEALRGLGSEAMYLCVDVTDSEATSQAVDQVRGRWAPIDVLIHAAGVLADKRIIDKTPEQFQRVFDAKVLGLQSLLSATGSDPLRFICLFSSVAGRYGNVGQADYAMANAAMNRIAREQAQRRGADCIVRSLNWGPWDGGMVTPELREHFQMRGIPLIPVADGTAAFVREFHHASTDPADVDVVLAVRS